MLSVRGTGCCSCITHPAAGMASTVPDVSVGLKHALLLQHTPATTISRHPLSALTSRPQHTDTHHNHHPQGRPSFPPCVSSALPPPQLLSPSQQAAHRAGRHKSKAARTGTVAVQQVRLATLAALVGYAAGMLLSVPSIPAATLQLQVIGILLFKLLMLLVCSAVGVSASPI